MSTHIIYWKRILTNKLFIQGNNIPNPIQQFDESNFPPYITNVLQRLGYSTPTTIQAQGWPIALSGKNLVGIAQTGSGKTLAVINEYFAQIEHSVIYCFYSI